MNETVVNLWDVMSEKGFRELHEHIKYKRYTHFWIKGGRGSLKSSTAGLEIVLGIVRDPEANAVVLRKTKESLKDSVFTQIEWAIEMLQIGHYWKAIASPLRLIYKPTGQMILFRGADNPTKIKSLKFKKGYCKFIWYEELDEFRGIEEIRTINQSLMRGGEQFVVLYSYNPPKSINNWVNAEAKLTRKDRYVHHSTYLDVPVKWLGPQFIVEADYLKSIKEEAYRHEYLGEVVGTGAEIFPNVQIRPISDQEIAEFSTRRRGIDFGFTTDPFVYLDMHYNRKYNRLYIFFEIYKTQYSLSAAANDIAAENPRKEAIFADSAEPRSINELTQRGLRVLKAKKGPDSIDYGIKFLQSLDAIVIDDIRCPETAREFTHYEHEKDKNGNIVAKYPDKDNHTIDGTRYALTMEVLDHRERETKGTHEYEEGQKQSKGYNKSEFTEMWG